MGLQSWKMPQTWFLGLGIALFYSALVLWQGNRPVVWLSGGSVAAIAVGLWLKEDETLSSNQSLLDTPYFLTQIEVLESGLANPKQPLWQESKRLSLESQAVAVQILQRESVFLPELLETLHTVLDLAGQVVSGLTVLNDMQTDAYRQLAQERVQISGDRLRQTHAQLQELKDQINLASLDQTQTLGSELPTQLKLLIAENKNSLKTLN